MGITKIIYDSYFGMRVDRWGDTFIGFNPDPTLQNIITDLEHMENLLYSERPTTWWLVIRCDIEHSKRRPKDWFNPYHPQYSMAIRRPRKLRNRTAKNEYRKITNELI